MACAHDSAFIQDVLRGKGEGARLVSTNRCTTAATLHIMFSVAGRYCLHTGLNAGLPSNGLLAAMMDISRAKVHNLNIQDSRSERCEIQRKEQSKLLRN